MPPFEENLQQLQTKVEAMLAAEQVPLVFLDLDDTLNRRFGALIEDEAVTALRHLDEAGGLFGLDLGADISWAGERILQETDRFFPFAFMLLATGKYIYAWAPSLQAYVRLPIQADNKGQAIRKLAEYLALPLEHCLFIADFPRPGAGQGQVGIDDPVLRERVGVIVNVGGQRRPEEIRAVFPETLLLNPLQQGNTLVGIGYQATVRYLASLTEVLQHESHAEQVKARRAEVMRAVEQKLHLPVPPTRAHQLWTFEHSLEQAQSHQPVLIRVKEPGMVHAGIQRDGKWARIYDMPLQEASPGVWEAQVLDPEVDTFTFIWYDSTRAGNVHWEGKNYLLQKRYSSKTWIHPQIEIRTSSIEGRGMFATAPIQAGEKVVVFGGEYTDEEGARKAQKESKLVMQWDENVYSVEGNGVDDGYFINHSCDPNTWMQDAFTLLARRDIQKGEELTADYALWEADEKYVSKWECHCTSPLCRKRVTGKDWRLKELQERYSGHFSPLLNKRIQKLT